MNSTRYNYSCAACQGSVTKTPTGKSKGEKGTIHGLHGWECNNCGRGAKVSRALK
jgi:DNA-directed RNA polymerase subunit RPC12/RpoP